MKAFIARGSAPRHASFMGAIGVGKAVAGWGLRLPVAPIGVFLAFFAAAGLAFAAGTGAAGAGAWAGACLGGGAGLAGAEVLGDAGSDLLEALLPIDMRTALPSAYGTSSRRNSAGGVGTKLARLEFNTEASSHPRPGPTSKRVKRTRGERAVAMASRKRTLLKVIILGDSGCVPAAIPPALDAPTTSRHFSVFQDFSPGGYARRGDATPARGFDRAPATGDVASSRQRAHRTDPRSEPARAERCPAARRPTDPRSRPPPSSRTPAQKHSKRRRRPLR